MALLRRKRKAKPKAKAKKKKPARSAAGCAPARKPAATKAKRSAKSKGSTKASKAAKARKATQSRAAARGASAGGGVDVTAAAKRKAAMARDRDQRCVTPKPSKKVKKPARKPAPKPVAPAPQAPPAAAVPASPPAAPAQPAPQAPAPPAPVVPETPTAPPAPVVPETPPVAPADPAPTAPETPTVPETPPATPEPPETPATPEPEPATPEPEPATPEPEPEPPKTPAPAGRRFGRREAQRLLWRASCGPRPGEVDRLVEMGLDAAVEHLLNPGDESLTGPAPTVGGKALKPYDVWGHDHLYYLDAMVRGNHGLRWRMMLVWHDWFACSAYKAPVHLMMRQLLRFYLQGLGRFDDLARDTTSDPAMLEFLDGIRSVKGSPNENYAREFFELFTLGANRGAYTEQDIREAARALTGFNADWNGSTLVNFRFDTARHDSGVKTIFGQSGHFGWQDVVRLAVEHPEHASWFVHRLWGAFVGEPMDTATRERLEVLYVDSGREIVPVLREILKHPRFYDGPAMVVPPAVYNAGLLRAVGRGVDTDAWAWLGDMCGQLLLHPPNVSGWKESGWLGSAAFDGRWAMATYVLRTSALDPAAPYDTTETGEAAVVKALAHLADPVLTPETRAALVTFADDLCPPTLPSWQRSRMRAMRQNALRMLIATSSDLVCA